MKKLTAKIFSSNDNYIYVYENIININFDSLDRGNVSNAFEFGIYSNNGSITFLDFEESFKKLLLKDSELKKYKVEIYISNELYDKKIATFLIEDYDYNNEQKAVEITLKDSVISWQNITVSEMFIFEPTSAYDILMLSVSNKIKHFKVGSFAEDVLKNIIVYCPKLEQSSLWKRINDICELSMCRVFEDEDGIPKIEYSYFYKDPIVIRASNIFEQVNNDVYSRSKTNLSIVLKNREKKFSVNVSNPIYFSLWTYTAYPDYVIYFYRGNDKSANALDITPQIELGVEDSIMSGETTLFDNTYRTSNIKAFGNYIFQKGTSEISQEVELGLVTYNTEISKSNNNVKFETVINATSNAGDSLLPTSKVLNGRLEIIGDRFEDDEDVTVFSQEPSSDLELINIPSNELFQTQNYIFDSNEVFSEWFINSLKSNYSNDQQFVELVCNFGNYYDENGNQIINGDGFVQPIQGFSKYDIVIPYVYRNGIEQPLSLKKDGSPKPFKIVGISYSYSGLLKQHLYLQEQLYNQIDI